ncbi:MAG: hypothetical protein WDZ35_04005 [Crocinitomicaceae bacterium]
MTQRLLLILFLPLFSQALGQEAAMFFREGQIKIGEQTQFTLQLRYQNPEDQALIAWPQFDKMLTDHIEIIDRTVDFDELIDTSQHIYLRKQEFTITCFQAGRHVLQPVGIELNDSMYYTNKAELLVETVEIDTSKGIYDIKGNYAVEYTFTEKVEDWFKKYWPWLAGAGGLIAVLFLIRLIRKRLPEQEAPKVPPVPAHLTALKALLDLKKEEAWKSGDPKSFYSELTYTVRLYLEQRFGIKAIERTTREIISDLKFADISEEDKVYLRKILSEADMVKFAKMIPDETIGEQSLDRSIDFVERTKEDSESEDE